MPNVKLGKENAPVMLTFSPSLPRLGFSGSFERKMTMNATAKIPIARKNTGFADDMLLAEPPMSPPTITGASVAPSELHEPPNCTS